MRSARTQNTGKPSEEAFDDAFKRLGKMAHVFAFTDAAEATGRNKKVVGIKAQPADRLVSCAALFPDEPLHYAEIKSTVHQRLFEFSMLRPKQGAYAAFALAAGAPYFVYVHSLHRDRWYRIPYQAIRAHKDLGRSSMSWDHLNDNFAWELP